MSLIYFVTHPEVVIDKKIDIKDWSLSEIGKKRIVNFIEKNKFKKISKIFSSNEVKARETAQIFADKFKLEIEYLEELGEMDRSATGFLEKEEFEETVEKFFKYPNKSIRDWEKAVDAKNRIVRIYKEIIDNEHENILVVFHGGVGALLMSFFKKEKISIKNEQKKLGSYYVWDYNKKKLIQDWEEI